jgi:tetratricopeptide (TPR) repeat protein
MELSIRQQVELAKDRFTSQDYYGAIHLLEELIERGSAYADAQHLLGLSYELLGKPDRALSAFDRALELNPRYVEAHVHRGIVLAGLGREGEAAEAFERARQAGGEDRGGLSAHHAAKLANRHAELAEAYAEAGAVGRAIAQYRTALELAPDFHDLRLRMARHMIDAGRTLEARDELQAVVDARPDLIDAQATFGLACYLSGEWATAQRVLEHLLREAPSDPRVRAYMSMLERGSRAAR